MSTHHHLPPDDSGDDGGGDGPGLRRAAHRLSRQAADLLALAADPSRTDTGELAALCDVLDTLDTLNATAVELTGHVQHTHQAERHSGLSLEGLLALHSRTTYGDRRTLVEAADRLAHMPRLRAAFHHRAVGWAQLRAILAETRRLSREQLARLDHGFTDHDRLARYDPDVLVDLVRDTVATLAPRQADQDRRRTIEHRFLALAPALDGSGTGYFELDATAFAPVAEALHAALPPPSPGPNDISRHAVDGPHTDGAPDAHRGDEQTPDGEPAFCDPVPGRTRARQRADALVALAEHYLTGTGGGGRARPAIRAICDLTTLAHDRATAGLAHALIAASPGRLRLTHKTLQRLRCDATLQVLFTDGGEILGTTRPTDQIPDPVREAVHTRDQGCRFPGCAAPIHWTDLHHVVFRQHGGPTTVDNLVTLCRRHHTAVHEGGWKLDMTPHGTVTLRRGRQHHTTDPPHQRHLPTA